MYKKIKKHIKSHKKPYAIGFIVLLFVVATMLLGKAVDLGNFGSGLTGDITITKTAKTGFYKKPKFNTLNLTFNFPAYYQASHFKMWAHGGGAAEQIPLNLTSKNEFQYKGSFQKPDGRYYVEFFVDEGKSEISKCTPDPRAIGTTVSGGEVKNWNLDIKCEERVDSKESKVADLNAASITVNVTPDKGRFVICQGACDQNSSGDYTNLLHEGAGSGTFRVGMGTHHIKLLPTYTSEKNEYGNRICKSLYPYETCSRIGTGEFFWVKSTTPQTINLEYHKYKTLSLEINYPRGYTAPHFRIETSGSETVPIELNAANNYSYKGRHYLDADSGSISIHSWPRIAHEVTGAICTPYDSNSTRFYMYNTDKTSVVINVQCKELMDEPDAAAADETKYQEKDSLMSSQLTVTTNPKYGEYVICKDRCLGKDPARDAMGYANVLYKGKGKLTFDLAYGTYEIKGSSSMVQSETGKWVCAEPQGPYSTCDDGWHTEKMSSETITLSSAPQTVYLDYPKYSTVNLTLNFPEGYAASDFLLTKVSGGGKKIDMNLSADNSTHEGPIYVTPGSYEMIFSRSYPCTPLPDRHIFTVSEESSDLSLDIGCGSYW